MLRKFRLRTLLILAMTMFVDINYGNASFCRLEDWMAAAYQFFNKYWTLVCEISFFDRWSYSKLTASKS